MTKPRLLHFPGTIVLLLLAIVATGNPAMAASNGQTMRSIVAPGWAYADFDGDYKPDLVQLRRSFLDLRLSTGKELHLAASPGSDTPGVEVVVVDLDGDHDFDIVVRNRFLNQHPDIWLNDGRGFFTKSATHDFPFPFERDSWSQSPTMDPGTALIVKISRPLSIAGAAPLLPTPSSGAELHSASIVSSALSYTDTSHPRGPPIPTSR
jgi:hypothetical protein